MTKKHVLIIRVAAVWTFYVWAVLVRNMIIDHSNTLAFRVVHIGLAVVSFSLAAATWWASNAISREIKSRSNIAKPSSEAAVIDSPK
jgi:hypothetical protein